ncbi:MAG: DUF2262 domain-containing protein [Bacteroidia bacterium]|nr:DUF2262 domain-containing protein [Bacteroidia bacterium]
MKIDIRASCKFPALFSTPELREMELVDKIALELFAKEEEWDLKGKQQILEGLLSLKNETWLEEGEKPLSKKEFLHKIKLESIVVFRGGEFQF